VSESVVDVVSVVGFPGFIPVVSVFRPAGSDGVFKELSNLSVNHQYPEKIIAPTSAAITYPATGYFFK